MLSIIVSWKNRIEILQSIESLLQTAIYLNGELIIVNFDGDRGYLDKLNKAHVPNLKIVNVSNQPMFNKAASNNIGAANSQFEHLFFCDCDIIIDPIIIKNLFDKITSNTKYFGTLAGVKETILNSIQNNHIISFGYELVIKTKDNRKLIIKDSEEDANDGTRNAPGLLMTSKENFISVNGYNSNLVGWGWEDQDMIGRLTLGGGFERIIFGNAIHISHNDIERTKHYPLSNRWESRDKMFRQALMNYDQNNFSGTFNLDIQKYIYR